MMRGTPAGIIGILGLALSLPAGCISQQRTSGAPEAGLAAPQSAEATEKERDSGRRSAAGNSVDERCASGDGGACLALGFQKLNADDGDAAMLFFQKAAESGDPRGYAHQGFMLWGGRLVERDEKQAGALLAKSCRAEVAFACVGAAVLAPDDTVSLELIKKGCKLGDRGSCVELAITRTAQNHPEFDQGVTRLKEECADSEKPKAAAKACQHLGYLAELGVNMKVDLKQAIELYRKACELSEVTCTFLGDAYLHGRGVSKSHEKAEELYERACDAGLPDACGGLAIPSESDPSPFGKIEQ